MREPPFCCCCVLAWWLLACCCLLAHLVGEHRGRVDGRALEDARIELALLLHAEDLRSGHGGVVRLEALDGARREDEHAVRALAAEALLPREGDDVEVGPRHVHREDGGRRVADREARAVGRRRPARRAAHAGGRAIVGEDDVVRLPVDALEGGEHAVVGLAVGDVLELELLRDVRVPLAAERLEVHHRHRLRPEQRPHRHLDGARVRRGHDADVVVLRQAVRLEQLARLL